MCVHLSDLFTILVHHFLATNNCMTWFCLHDIACMFLIAGFALDYDSIIFVVSMIFVVFCWLHDFECKFFFPWFYLHDFDCMICMVLFSWFWFHDLCAVLLIAWFWSHFFCILLLALFWLHDLHGVFSWFWAQDFVDMMASCSHLAWFLMFFFWAQSPNNGEIASVGWPEGILWPKHERSAERQAMSLCHACVLWNVCAPWVWMLECEKFWNKAPLTLCLFDFDSCFQKEAMTRDFAEECLTTLGW